MRDTLPERKGSEPAGRVRYRRHLSEQDRSRIVTEYLAGQTVYQLAAQFGVHRDRIFRILEAADIDRRYHQTVDVDLARAAELEAEGLSLTRIADQLRMSMH